MIVPSRPCKDEKPLSLEFQLIIYVQHLQIKVDPHFTKCDILCVPYSMK